MAELDSAQVSEIREMVHSLNNVLNTISLQAELVRMLADGSAPPEKISGCVETIIKECKKGGQMARDVSRIVKTAAGVQ